MQEIQQRPSCLQAGITSIPLKTHLVRALTVLSLPARRALEETAPERATQKASGGGNQYSSLDLEDNFKLL